MKIYRVKVLNYIFSTPAKNKTDAFRSFKAMAKGINMNPEWVKLGKIYKPKTIRDLRRS